MRRFGNLALIILSISILSYGFSGLTYAPSHEDCGPNQVFQLGFCQDIEKTGPQDFTIDTDHPSYDDGDTIRITGNVGTLSESFPNTPLTIMITGPTNNIIGIAQITPDASGQFSHNVMVGGSLENIQFQLNMEHKHPQRHFHSQLQDLLHPQKQNVIQLKN